MRYYEGHETVYQRLRDRGCSTWDEFLGQAADFDSFCMKQFVEEALERSSFVREPPLALEIGCGTGPICCFLAEGGFEVEGIDISATAIAIAREQAEARGLSVKYRVADVCHDRLQQLYDLVVDGHCLHCIVTEEDRHKALRNVCAAIRPGGHFWLDTMIADSATDFGKDTTLDDDGILWVKIPTPGRFDLEKQIAGETYVANRRVYRDPKYLESELQMAGFVIERSNAAAPEENGQSATYQAICTVR
jgi:SAM-dependent methyltransferase